MAFIKLSEVYALKRNKWLLVLNIDGSLIKKAVENRLLNLVILRLLMISKRGILLEWVYVEVFLEGV